MFFFISGLWWQEVFFIVRESTDRDSSSRILYVKDIALETEVSFDLPIP